MKHEMGFEIRSEWSSDRSWKFKRIFLFIYGFTRDNNGFHQFCIVKYFSVGYQVRLSTKVGE